MKAVIDSIQDQIHNSKNMFQQKFCDLLHQTFLKITVWQQKLSFVDSKLNQVLPANYQCFEKLTKGIAKNLFYSLGQIIELINGSFNQVSSLLLDELKKLDSFNQQYEKLFSIEDFTKKKIEYSFDFSNSFNNRTNEIVSKNQAITSVVLVRDKIFVGCYDSTITVYNLKLEKLQRIRMDIKQKIRSLVYYNYGNQEYLLSSGDDQKYCIFSLDFESDSTILQTYKVINTASCSRQAYYFNNHIISSGGQKLNHDLLAFNLQQNQYSCRFQFHRNFLLNLKVHTNCILSTDQSGYTVRWNILENSIIKIINQKRLINLNCSDYGEIFNYFGTETGKIVIASNKMKIIRNMKLSKSKILHIQQIDNSHLIFICYPNYFFLYNSKTNCVQNKFQLDFTNSITTLQLNVKKRIFILGNNIGEIFLQKFHQNFKIK